MTHALPPSSPAIAHAKAACVSYLATIEKTNPGDGGALRVPYGSTYVRVSCYHRANGELVVRVSRPHRVRHYHVVFDESQP